MKHLTLAALIAHAPAALAISPLADVPRDAEAHVADQADTRYFEESLAAIEAEMKTLKEKYPDRMDMPAGVETELSELAYQYDQIERKLQFRRHAMAVRTGRGLASDSQPRRPAAGAAVEHLNGTCPFVTDTLSRAGNLRDGGIRWKENGRLEIKDSIPSTTTGNSQALTLRGQNLPFRLPGGTNERNIVKLAFSDDGKIRQLEVQQLNQLARWSQTMEYDWNGDQCQLDRVIVTSPQLHLSGTSKGVSFDRGICQALDAKGLLDEKKIGECSDFNDSIGATMEKAMRDWKEGQHFTLFVTDPSGATRLQAWNRKSHLSVNASIARDCAFHLQGGRKPNPVPPAHLDADPATPVIPAH